MKNFTLLGIFLLTGCFCQSFAELDPNFGTKGWVTHPVPGLDYVCNAQINPNGKLLLASKYENPVTNVRSMAVIQLNQDGSIDKNFGRDGLLESEVSGFTCGDSLSLTSDGKILVGGVINNQYLAISRYFPNGKLDPSFGVKGIWSIDLKTAFLVPSLSVDEKGRIVVYSLSFTQNHITALALRLSSEGSLDTTFGVGGVGRAYLPHMPVRLSRIATSDKGAGIFFINSPGPIFSNQYLIKFDENGMPDKNLGIKGIKQLRLPDLSQDIYVTNATFSKDRSFLLPVIISERPQISTLRVKLDGSLDTTFANQGYLLSPAGQSAYTQGVHLLPNGKIVTAGTSIASNEVYYPTLMRYSERGELDTSFGDGGVLKLPLDKIQGSFSQTLPLTDGKYLAIGFGYLEDTGYIVTAKFLK